MSSPVFSRVEESVKRHTNGEMRRRLRMQLSCYANASTEEITQRLKELDNEWSLERVNQATGAGIALFGVVMSLIRRRWWMFLTAAMAGFLLQHTIRGWSPPMNLLRRLGLRTIKEIEEERQALKVLRGDFGDIPVLSQNGADRVNHILEIIEQ